MYPVKNDKWLTESNRELTVLSFGPSNMVDFKWDDTGEVFRVDVLAFEFVYLRNAQYLGRN